MKKLILVMTIAAFSVSTILTSCNTPAENVEDAREDVKEANEELDKANIAYVAEVDTFRVQVAERIAANKQNMAEFRTRIATEKAEARMDYEKKIADLEKKNSDMQMKMDNYKVEVKDNWTSFKKEFNHDMDEIGKAFSDLTKKNTK